MKSANLQNLDPAFKNSILEHRVLDSGNPRRDYVETQEIFRSLEKEERLSWKVVF